MKSITYTPRLIQKWTAPSLDQIVGCDQLKTALQQSLVLNGHSQNMLITGGTGTGKTASVKAYVQTLVCHRSSEKLPRPCGLCAACQHFDVRQPQVGLFVPDAPGVEPVNYQPVNCGAVTEADLRAMLKDMEWYSGLKLIYLDEAHRLTRRKMEQLLLVPMEEMDAVWIASSAEPDQLSNMFLRRFPKRISTTSPTKDELVEFIYQRCREFSIVVDTSATVDVLAQCFAAIPSEVIAVLANAASTPDRTLTLELVKRQQATGTTLTTLSLVP